MIRNVKRYAGISERIAEALISITTDLVAIQEGYEIDESNFRFSTRI
jgi:hypothetical protein